MNGDILVSVIIPVYNVEKYLLDCVESFINQTYRKIQILLIDDGSTDTSGNLCDEVAKLDKRIEVTHKENEGLGLTRNFGLNHADGKYVLFADSDDYMDINAIEKMVYTAETENAQLVIAGFYRVTNEKNILSEEKYKYEIFEKNRVKDELLARMIGSLPYKRDSIFTMACGKLYLTESIKKNNIFYQSEREIQSEDLAFQLDYVPYVKRAIVLDEIFYYYRNNPDSLTMKYKENRFEEAIKVYQYVLNKIKQIDLPNDTYLRADKMLFVYLKSILIQELSRNGKKARKECLIKYGVILNHSIVRNAVNEYPIRLLSFEQKIFLYLVKFRLKILLMVAIQIKKYSILFHRLIKNRNLGILR
jgi:glycosyltransferase involved in cell wall biosynthesis